jgi:DNA-binding MarR family transcriptional regulator
MISPDPASVDLGTLAWLAGTSANEHLLAALRRATRANVRTGHGYVFQHLLSRPHSVGELAELLSVSQQAVSKVVAELEGLGFVSRAPDAEDKRMRRVALTRKGLALVERSRAARAALEARLVEELGPAAVRDAKRVLVALLRATGGVETVTARRVKPAGL